MSYLDIGTNELADDRMSQAWYGQNLQIAVPVTVVAAILILLLLWALIMCMRYQFTSKRPISQTFHQAYGVNAFANVTR